MCPFVCARARAIMFVCRKIPLTILKFISLTEKPIVIDNRKGDGGVGSTLNVLINGRSRVIGIAGCSFFFSFSGFFYLF